MVTEADSYDPLRLMARVQKYYEHYGQISVNLVQHLYRHQISERLRFFKSIYMKLLLEIPILKRYIVASRKCATKLFKNIHERIYQLLVTT